MTNPPSDIRCPTCGQPDLRRVFRDVTTRAAGRVLVVHDVEVDECENCGERLYDLPALRRIRDARTHHHPSGNQRIPGEAPGNRLAQQGNRSRPD
jgi:YgiT-type zinc finger domain-containing protein